MKTFAFVLLAFSSGILSSQAVIAGPHSRGDSEEYALEYCRYYKTRAMYAGRKARANQGVARYRNKALVRWARYNACLKENGWPTQYRPPTY
ncbi:MAG TPA: hypothetical protein ENJ55_03270 [Rhizobiales bacterium]|nr:hypothetical protein [Hyphomicrobiales bacterium]